MAFDLSKVQRGRRIRAPKVVAYAAAKLGKTTLASEMDDVLILRTEDGTDALDVAVTPVLKTYEEVIDVLESLATEDHGFKSLAVDSLDWLEPLIWAFVCKEHKVESIELVGGGFGKGYHEAASVWVKFLNALDYLRNEKGMAVLLIAHDIVKTMSPPDGEPYTYSTLKLNDKAVGKVTEWADITGALVEKRFTKSTDMGFNKQHSRAVKAGQRVLIVGKDPAYVTGNRFSMPDEIVLPRGGSWNAVVAAMGAGLSSTVKPVVQQQQEPEQAQEEPAEADAA